jgi:hypothetical protein
MPSRPYDAQGAAGLAEAMRLIVLRDTGTQEAIGSSDVFDVQSKAGVKVPGGQGVQQARALASFGRRVPCRAGYHPAVPANQSNACRIRCLQVGEVPCDEAEESGIEGAYGRPKAPQRGGTSAPDWWANDGSRRNCFPQTLCTPSA